MRFIRFQDEHGQIRYGTPHGPDAARILDGDPVLGFTQTEQVCRVAKLLSPIVPTSIIAIGLNYLAHAKETNAKIPQWPVVFFKNVGSVNFHNGPIGLPRALRSDKVDFEGELAVVIGKPCKNVSRANALDYVLGYACANDVSARDWQKEWGGGQWSRAKSFDTFCPLGPVLVTPDEIANPNALALKTTLNGKTVQESNTSDMIFDVPTLIEFLSGSTTLAPLTVILTGTPSGVGMARDPQLFMNPGAVSYTHLTLPTIYSV